MDFWLSLQVHKWPSAGWFLIYVICLLLMYRNRKRWGTEVKSILCFIGLSILLFLCPIFAKIMTSSLLPSFLEYERMTWLLFIGPVVAYTLVKIISDLKPGKRKKMLASIIVVAVLLSNVTIFSRGYKIADNWLKIPEDVLGISEAIMEDATQTKPVVLVQEEQDNGLIGNWLYHGIRQYTSVPVLVPLYISSEEYSTEWFSLINYNLMNYQYFVCTNADSLRTQAEAAGFELIYESDEHLLFKNVKECTIYFVRHGQTDANVENVFSGSGTDAMLTEEGREQATETGKALSEINFEKIYTSELTRTKDTANLILAQNKKTDENQEAIVLPSLNDIAFGEIEGLTLDGVLSQYPDFSEDKYLGKYNDFNFVSPIGSESKCKVASRFDYAINNQIVAQTSSGTNVLVVGHSSMLWWLQRTFGEDCVDRIDNASITVLKYNQGKWEVQCIGESAEEYEVAND